jgi:hypothetical protein
MQAINKTEALQRLTELEKQAGELRKIIDAPVKITDRVKTFEDACDVVGTLPDNVKTLLSYNGIDGEMRASVAHMKLQIIAKALNEGWVPNWNKSSEYKYHPWFDFSSSSGFSFSVYDCGCSRSPVGSRLCFKSRELAEYAGKQFTELYKDYMAF